MTLSDIAQELRELTESIGANRFHLFTISELNKPKLAFRLDHGFPQTSAETTELVGRLPRRFAEKISQTFHPMTWGIDLPGKVSGLHWEQISSLEDNCGVVLPLATEQRQLGVIFFIGNVIYMERDALFDLHGRCHALFAQTVERDPFPLENQGPAISKRELQCLKLTANGLTSEEIAKRLGLSVHTANQYLANTTQKLNAVNRVHAVAKALRTGLID
ncbi:helix-turn-helix transcriptional regulator [uncultured Nitratireductor sp.]|mgnify:CR=1 FL=1|uniref:response regulator transcription factor n=1 Tax=uncultured Nitratireductor sp. TaxID=520953 RepID=UPI0025D7B8FA|nr:helix-turn-helix transcriptional regulator [uncultured Nitratireductor sp.]